MLAGRKPQPSQLGVFGCPDERRLFGGFGVQQFSKCRIYEHRTTESRTPCPTGKMWQPHIFILSYQNSFISMGQKHPKLLGVRCSHPRRNRTNHWGSTPGRPERAGAGAAQWCGAEVLHPWAAWGSDASLQVTWVPQGPCLVPT